MMKREIMTAILRWLDSEAGIEDSQPVAAPKTVDWFRIVPFVLLHAGCLGVVWVGWSPVAVWTAVIMYLVRMFAITGFYHRYFAHKAFKFHATCTINSLDHMIGTRRFDTPDTSRNNALLAIITLGEGWHNDHHHYAVSARQGFRW
jgi:fatty-acid desaturase